MLYGIRFNIHYPQAAEATSNPSDKIIFPHFSHSRFTDTIVSFLRFTHYKFEKVLIAPLKFTKNF